MKPEGFTAKEARMLRYFRSLTAEQQEEMIAAMKSGREGLNALADRWGISLTDEEEAR